MKILCTCNICRIELEFDKIHWDSVIRSLEHPTGYDRLGTINHRLKDFVIAKIFLALPEVNCLKSPKKSIIPPSSSENRSEKYEKSEKTEGLNTPTNLNNEVKGV